MKSEETGHAGAPKVSRRRVLDAFLGVSVTAMAAAIVYPVIRFISPPNIPEATDNRVLAGKVSEITKEGWKLFPFGSQAGILIMVAPGNYKAMSATCTHLECTVQFDKSSKRIWCACHNGYYDQDGRNVAGPPPRPLTPYTVQVEGDDIFVSKG
jgi:cytochrome b6-f complex iron-sulfur subunit